MSKFKEWLVTKYLNFETQAVTAMETADFYGNLFTERQKFYIAVILMVFMAVSSFHGAVQFIAFVYIMSKLTSEDKK